MTLKLLLTISIFIWNADSQIYQNPFTYGADSPPFELMKFLYGNLQNSASQAYFGQSYNVNDNGYSRAYGNNGGQQLLSNRFLPENQIQNQQSVRTQPSIYRETNAPQTRPTFNNNLKNGEAVTLNNGLVPNNRVTNSQQQIQVQQPIYRQPNVPNYNKNPKLNNLTSNVASNFFNNNQPSEREQGIAFREINDPKNDAKQKNNNNHNSKITGSIPLSNGYISGNKDIIYNQPQIQTQQPIYTGNSYESNHYTTSPIFETTTKGYFSPNEAAVDTGKINQNANVDNSTFAITSFGLKLLKAMNRNMGNVVASPYSIAMLLALVQQGSSGRTQQEINQLLQMSPESSKNIFKGLTDVMKKRGFQNILKVANNVVLANAFNVNPKFKSTAINNFASDVTRVNFNNPVEAAQTVNYWVTTQTNYKITNLLAPDAIQPDTQAALVNAVYFKGIWETKFKVELTQMKEFNLSDGSKKVVPFMQSRRMFQTDFDPTIQSQVILLPFQGTQYSMVIILPSQGISVSDVLFSITESQLYEYQQYTPKEVLLEIPRFTVRTDSDIGQVLNALGLWTMFSNEADLTSIGSHNGISPRISTGIHSALLSIDEQGGSAAAATAFSVVALSYDDSSISFDANRPFLAVLWDTQFSMPLFMAKIEDPMA